MKHKKLGYASLSEDQRGTLAKAIKGQFVLDLGCGDMSLTVECARLGAKGVVGVDKVRPPNPAKVPVKIQHKVRFWEAFFEDCAAQFAQIPAGLRSPYGVGLLSWPINWSVPGLMRVVEQLPVLVYLGQNLAGTSCGTPAMFEEFTRRELLAYLPAPHNSMLVLGNAMRHRREPTYAEKAGLLSASMVMFPWRDEEPWFAPGWAIPAFDQEQDKEDRGEGT